MADVRAAMLKEINATMDGVYSTVAGELLAAVDAGRLSLESAADGFNAAEEQIEAARRELVRRLDAALT